MLIPAIPAWCWLVTKISSLIDSDLISTVRSAVDAQVPVTTNFVIPISVALWRILSVPSRADYQGLRRVITNRMYLPLPSMPFGVPLSPQLEMQHVWLHQHLANQVGISQWTKRPRSSQTNHWVHPSDYRSLHHSRQLSLVKDTWEIAVHGEFLPSLPLQSYRVKDQLLSLHEKFPIYPRTG